MLTVANPTWRRQHERTFVNNGGSAPLFASTSAMEARFSFVCQASTCSLGDDHRQPRLERLLDTVSIVRR
jgi:hypothetical protein